MAYTVPADIPAGAIPRGSDLYTLSQAIRELQRAIDWTYTWVCDNETESVTISQIPSDLAVLTLYCNATTDSTFREEPAVHALVNGQTGLYDYAFRYTYFWGNEMSPVVYTDIQNMSRRAFVGSCRSTVVTPSYPTTSEVTFGNWGVGSDPLSYVGNVSNFRQGGIVGGHFNGDRPYTSLTLFPSGYREGTSPAQFLDGSSFTLVGRYP
jgi:hypothetical protein